MQLFTGIKKELLRQIVNSKKNIRIAVTWFTDHDLFNAILQKLENPSFQVELIVLNDQINNKYEGVNFQRLIDLKGKFYFSDVNNMVHHKFCIIDDEILITGSYNWTYYAENRNWENIVIIKDTSIIRAYNEEFEKIIEQHELVSDVSIKLERDSITPNNYLMSDYIIQAQNELSKGNELLAGKLYTEILKYSPRDNEIIEKRTQVLKKYNFEELKILPFEIGIEYYKTGYKMVIPMFQELPVEIKSEGSTVFDQQKRVLIKIQKFDFSLKTILELSLDNIKPSPVGKKIECVLKLDRKGLLSIICREIGGCNRTASTQKNIKHYIT